MKIRNSQQEHARKMVPAGGSEVGEGQKGIVEVRGVARRLAAFFGGQSVTRRGYEFRRFRLGFCRPTGKRCGNMDSFGFIEFGLEIMGN